MRQHTPGPWKSRKEHHAGRYGNDFAYRIIGNPSKDYPGAVRFDPCMIFNDGQLNRGLAKANARLIAAAPELLTVLQTIEKAFVESCGDFHFADYEHLVLQAIAKAEGREGT